MNGRLLLKFNKAWAVILVSLLLNSPNAYSQTYYEQVLQRIFVANRLPTTQVKVRYVSTPTARIIAEKLIDEAILYEKEPTGTLIYEKVKNRAGFIQARNKIVNDLLAEPGFFQPGDKLVKITITPENRPTLEMFGLAHADGTPKMDAIYSKHVMRSWSRDSTKKGSWDYKYHVDWNNGLGTRKVTNGIEARIDTSACHINNSSAREVFVLHDGINIDGECTPAVITPYTKANPACGSHTHVVGQEDCIHFVTLCKSIFGLGAGNNLQLNIGAGFNTVINTSAGPVNVAASFAIDETFFTQTYPDIFEGRLCACIGNPFATSATADGKTQFENLSYGKAITTEIISPREPYNFCAVPEETRSSRVGIFGAGEISDTKPAIDTPLDGTR